MSKEKKKNTETQQAEDIKESENQETGEKAEKSELDALKEEVANQKDLLLRTCSEYANFRTRTEKEKASIYSNATADAVKAILPVADSLTMALETLKEAPEEYKKGIELVQAQLDKAFNTMGIECFGEKGEVFNPDLHNAIAHVEDEALGEGVIALVYQKGYKCGDKVIRHCMVSVAN